MLDMGTVFLAILMINFSSIFFFINVVLYLKSTRQLKIYVISPKRHSSKPSAILCCNLKC